MALSVVLMACESPTGPTAEEFNLEISASETVRVLDLCGDAYDAFAASDAIVYYFESGRARALREDPGRDISFSGWHVAFQPMREAGAYDGLGFKARCGTPSVISHEIGHVLVALAGHRGECFYCVWHEGDIVGCPRAWYDVACRRVAR